MEIEPIAAAPPATEIDSPPTIDVTSRPQPNNSWSTVRALAEELSEPLDRDAPVRLTDHPDGSTSVEAVQPTIPGIHPPFDVAAALDSIEQQEKDASQAEREYASAQAKAKELRAAADLANSKLRALIRDLNERRHDTRYEPSAAADMSESTRTHAESGELSGVARMGAAEIEDASPDPVSDVSSLGDLGTEGDEMPPATLKELLSKAGADITVEQIAAWNTDEQTSARVWAEQQRDANAGLNGESVSVAWPAHVSAAHHGGNHYPTKGKRKKQR